MMSGRSTPATEIEIPRNTATHQVVNPSNADAGASQRGRMRGKHKVVEDFESKLRIVKRAALCRVALYSFNRFAGFCSLTWATVVILGGFVQSLEKFDYLCVSALLPLEATRLAVTQFFNEIVTRNLVYRSTDPRKLQYDDSDRQMIVAFARSFGPPFETFFIIICSIIPAIRLRNVGSETKANSFDGRSYSLRIFYALVLLNAFVAAVSVIYSLFVTPWFIKSYSLQRYYDEVVWNGICKGLLHASDFPVLTFAFKMQSEEYRRNVRALTVRKLYEDLLEYLFWHKKGFEAARIALDSTDCYEQEAAANIVGLWTRWDKERRVLCLQRRLLAKLANMVDNEETGRAATSSFHSLAVSDPTGVLEVQSENREKLVDILISSIDNLVRSEKYDRTLVYVKALIPLLEERHCHEQMVNLLLLQGLSESLREVFTNDCYKRTKAAAGYALRKMNSSTPTEEDVNKYLLTPEVKEGEHILKDEKEYLLELVQLQELPKEWLTKLHVRIVDKQTDPCLATSSGKKTIFTAVAVTIAVIIAFLVLTFPFLDFWTKLLFMP